MFNLTTKPVSAGELMKKEKKPINFVVEKFISQDSIQQLHQILSR